MDGQHFCGLPEHLETAELRRRSNKAVWWLIGEHPTVKRDALRAAIQDAFDSWTAVCNCYGVEAASQEQADLLISIRYLDGPQRVLAQCELPGPPIQHMEIDAGDSFAQFDGPSGPQGKLDIGRILRHELGHFWSLGHLRSGLMAPYYSATVTRPTPDDAAPMVQEYGPPVPKPKPDPNPPGPNPGGSDVTIRITGADSTVVQADAGGNTIVRVLNAGDISVDGYRITKI